jgi:hypothetical protein
MPADHLGMNDQRLVALAANLARLVRYPPDADRVESLVGTLDESYGLGTKIEGAPGTQDVIEELVDRLVRAFDTLGQLRKKRILDIACGSNTSMAPPVFHLRTASAQKAIKAGEHGDHAPQFEPWLPRMLLALGADPVGVDIGDLSNESFEHYQVDLGRPGALNFLPDSSFDALQDSRLFGSPEFTARFPERASRLRIAAEIVRQEQRLLKPGGITIHSDAQAVIVGN